MNYFHVAWVYMLGLLFYVIATEPYFSDFLEIINRKLFLMWREFLFEIRWNRKYPWANYLIWRQARNNAEVNTIMLRKELGLPLDDG